MPNNDQIYTPIETSPLPPKYPPMGPTKKGKKSKTATGQKATPILIGGMELVENVAVVSWGRMNPPTKGHEKLVETVTNIAEEINGTPMIFLSQTHDTKRNPLMYEDKVRFARIAFGDIIQENKDVRTIVDMLKEVNKNFSNLILVVGEDRLDEMTERLIDMNGEHFFFENFQVVSAGKRDVLSESVEGVSGTKARNLVVENNFSAFIDTLPTNLILFAEEIFSLTRLGLQLEATLHKEELLTEVLSPMARIKKAQVMMRYAGKINRARDMAMERRATNTRLVARSRHHAILIMRQKLAGNLGSHYSELPPAMKTMIDTKIANARQAVISLSLKILPQVKKIEYSRLGAKVPKRIKMNESEVKEMVSGILNALETK